MAINIPRMKYRLRAKAREWNKAHPKDQITIPRRLRPALPRWNNEARVLAWRYSSRIWPKDPSARLDARLVEHLFPDRVPKLKLHRVKLDWARPLVPRSGRPTHIVWHHAAAKRCSVRTIHGWHLANGWSGFAYMFEVRKNGKVYVGRPENMLGGHTADWPGTIGIVFEGNFDVERMSDKQLRAGQALHRYLHRKYGCPDRGHRDMPGNSTGCPGRYFPLAEITKVK